MRPSRIAAASVLIAGLAAGTGYALQRDNDDGSGDQRAWRWLSALRGMPAAPDATLHDASSAARTPPRPSASAPLSSSHHHPRLSPRVPMRGDAGRRAAAEPQRGPIEASRLSRAVRVVPIPAVGAWRELIRNIDGTINLSEYRRVANSYNAPEIMNYRLGPTAVDFGSATNTAPRLWGPDQTSGFGLWSYGVLPTGNPGEPEKCVDSSRLPRSDEEARARGMEGPAWLAGGAFAYLPDNANDPDFRFGVGNIKGADGAVFEPSGGLCMRMYAQWFGDFWTRNNIAAPANPQIRELAARRPDLPLVPVAIARGRSNANQVSFAAFRDGTIAPIVLGNSAPELFDANPLRLPAGMVPTAMAVTPYNEFLVVTIWDTASISGKLAVIALRPRQMAVGNPGQTPNTRWYWGLPGAWTNRGMKLLGFVDLPFAAPTSVDVTNNVAGLGNPRGLNDNDSPENGDLSLQSARDRWASTGAVYATQHPWSTMAVGGYAVVASRAEGKVSFVDMTPLYQFYRRLYLTTQANYNRTVDASITDPNKFPFAFSAEPSQRPVVATTLNIHQPTAVLAGNPPNSIFGLERGSWFGESGDPGWSPKEPWSGAEPERYFARSRAYVASMDGTVRIFNVQGLNFPTSPVGRTVPATPLGQFAAGRNPSFAHMNSLSTAPDDIFVVSRGDRSVTFAFPDGRVQGTLRDNRLVDPVGAAVSLNQAGFGGRGAGRAVFTTFVSVVDYNGKMIHTYAVNPRRGALSELYPFTTPAGPSLWLWGSSRPFPGKPFVIDMEEII